MYLQSLAIRQNLVEELPDLPEIRRDLATSSIKLAILLERLGQSSQAEDRYNAALTELKTLAKELPEQPLSRHQLADCQRSLALLLIEQNRREEVEGLLQAGTSTLSHWPRSPLYA